MGNNKSGFINEDELMDTLDGKKYSELNDNLKKFIFFINNRKIPSGRIIAKKVGGQEKCDLEITINGTKTRVSIKKGSGNSVHQEPVGTFIVYLDKKFKDFNKCLGDDIRYFIWGDGTVDGSGEKSKRVSARKIAEECPVIIDRIKEFFKKHKRELIRRFLLEGTDGDTVDCIFYGNSEKALWARAEEVLDLLCSEEHEDRRSILPVGGLSFQAWNRAIGNSVTESTERKRGVIQIKWGNLERDLKAIGKNRADGRH